MTIYHHQPRTKIKISVATEQDRKTIYRMRHDVYATELAQHQENANRELRDDLDAYNLYVTAKLGEDIVGFISITPPGSPNYSVDKYVERSVVPATFNRKLWEVRLLTVVQGQRFGPVAGLLMYAAYRWVQSHGGEHIVGIGRCEVLDLYLKVGFEKSGVVIRSGAVKFELMTADINVASERIGRYRPLLRKLDSKIEWELEFPFLTPSQAYHGGTSITAIGDEFEFVDRRGEFINADVLDAWFPPSPMAVDGLRRHLPWFMATSPPSGNKGLSHRISRARGIYPECVMPGAGSSDLIFLAMKHWLNPSSRVLILDPTYGEYAHLLENVVRCRVDRLVLHRRDDYELRPSLLKEFLKREYQLVVLVNPNSPTGSFMPGAELAEILRGAPQTTRVWIDETYVEYVGSEHSLEQFAAQSENVVVCKSMSKVYALSGVRAAYLCAPPHLLEELRALAPPWSVSLPAQVASVAALADPEYYSERYRQTHELRIELVEMLSERTNLDIVPSSTNFVLCHLPAEGPDATAVVEMCRANGLYIRNASGMGSQLGDKALRIAVKDQLVNRRMVEILERVL